MDPSMSMMTTTTMPMASTPTDPSTLMSMNMMSMTFFSAKNTSLYSMAWTPSSDSGYAGTCIFLIILAMIYRTLTAVKTNLEHRWKAQAWQRRFIVVADKMPVSERLSADTDSKPAILTENGVEEHVRIVHRSSTGGVQPWRFSVDLPRAVMVTVTNGVGYLLMLAVMTFNIGYFISVLGGIFIGELTVGRFINSMQEH